MAAKGVAGARLAADIGGTFTDLALECPDEQGGAQRWTAKVLTTPAAPEKGVLEGIRVVLSKAGMAPAMSPSSSTARRWRPTP